jgi:hypothetical protein
MKITVLRAQSCIEGDTCAAVLRDEEEPDQLYVVVKPVTDPGKIAALAKHVGPGEMLSVFPAALLPEV